MKRTMIGLAAMTLFGALSVAPASANYITNGGFETGTTSGWTIATVTSGTANVSAAAVLDFVQPGIGAPYAQEEGNDMAWLGDNKAGGATWTQSVTDPGATATDPSGGLLLTYYVATDGLSATNSFSVKWDGVAIAASSISNSTSNAYTQYQFWVKATGHDTLQFIAQNTDGFWLLDDVELNVPEPASLALLGSGLLAGAVAFRRRRSAKKR